MKCVIKWNIADRFKAYKKKYSQTLDINFNDGFFDKFKIDIFGNNSGVIWQFLDWNGKKKLIDEEKMIFAFLDHHTIYITCEYCMVSRWLHIKLPILKVLSLFFAWIIHTYMTDTILSSLVIHMSTCPLCCTTSSYNIKCSCYRKPTKADKHFFNEEKYIFEKNIHEFLRRLLLSS